MLGPSTQKPFGVGLVAVDDEIPVAAGALRAQAIHPQRMWCYIETAPLQRQRGIATALLNQLLERAPENIELKTRSASTDLTTANWLTNQGFSPIQNTQRVIVASKSFESKDFEVQQLATGSVELSKVVAEYYNATHDCDPALLTRTLAQDLLSDLLAVAQQAFITRADTGITAFALAYPGPVPNLVDVFLGCDPNHPQPTHHIRALLATAGEDRSLA